MSAERPVRVSVLLPVRNGEAFLRGQLEALERQVCSFGWEVIVIDNGSSDGSSATAEQFACRLEHFTLLREDQLGKSHALNLGMATARGKHLVFVDADDEAGDGYLQKMSEALEEFDAVGGYIDTEELNPKCARQPLASNEGIPIYWNFRPGLPGCIVALRASLCAQVGLFDVDLQSAEDIDYTWRAAALGASFGRQLEAVMYVRRPPTCRDAFRKARGYGHSHIWMYERYRSEGMRRRTCRGVLAPVRDALVKALRKEGTWGWALAWQAGTLVGHVEESIRRRVFYP
jgi:glycosyltransferase involved in cell wall biosynthesis